MYLSALEGCRTRLTSRSPSADQRSTEAIKKAKSISLAGTYMRPGIAECDGKALTLHRQAGGSHPGPPSLQLLQVLVVFGLCLQTRTFVLLLDSVWPVRNQQRPTCLVAGPNGPESLLVLWTLVSECKVYLMWGAHSSAVHQGSCRSWKGRAPGDAAHGTGACCETCPAEAQSRLHGLHAQMEACPCDVESWWATRTVSKAGNGDGRRSSFKISVPCSPTPHISIL